MKEALSQLRNVHSEVKQEFNSIKSLYLAGNFSHLSPQETRQIMLEGQYQDILDNLRSAIRKMEILTNHLY